MMPMLDHPAFKPLPQLGQFAKNGSWETAWSFPRSQLPSRAEIDAYLAGAAEVAFEAFFGDAFFGARWAADGAAVAEFAFACVSALRAATDGASFFSHLSGNTSLRGWGRTISFAEVGAVNAWQSVGAFRIAAPAQAVREFERLWASLACTPLASNASCRKAVEFSCPLPVPHWFALPVSASQAPFGLCRDKLHRALESALALGSTP